MTHSALTWCKSSYSGGNNPNCVEVARPGAQQAAYVRDSKHPHLGHLSFPSGEWAAFLREVASDR
ncbi:DUF397 domain-containing protein, partial [Nocardiopsis suaedae]